MGDYIDRYSLLNDLKTSVVFSGRSGVVSSELKGANKVIDRIIAMPTEDVQKVKHGEWKAEGDCGITRCSVCGWTIEECIEDNYCRNCGAKMDGDVG